MNKLLASLLISLSLVACGGGGSDAPEHPAIEVAQNAPVTPDNGPPILPPPAQTPSVLTAAHFQEIETMCLPAGGFAPNGTYTFRPGSEAYVEGSDEVIAVEVQCNNRIPVPYLIGFAASTF